MLQSGERVRGSFFDVRWLESPFGATRVALVAPKHGRNSVARNKLKRRMREIARNVVLPTPVSFDMLFRARPEAYAAQFAELEADVTRAIAKVK